MKSIGKFILSAICFVAYLCIIGFLAKFSLPFVVVSIVLSMFILNYCYTHNYKNLHIVIIMIIYFIAAFGSEYYNIKKYEARIDEAYHEGLSDGYIKGQQSELKYK